MHPELLKFGTLSVKAYGFMLAVSFLAGIFLTARRAAKTGVMKPEKVFDLGIFIMLGSVAGARIVFVLINWDAYQDNIFSIFKLEGGGIGGLSMHGGLIGGAFAGVWFARRNKISIPHLADLVAPMIALGLGLTRVGCFLNGCCRGVEAGPQCPFPVKFPDEMIYRHPSQLYESLFGFILFAALYAYSGKNKNPGRVFLLFLLLYSVFRFFIEFLRRGVSAKLFVLGLTEAQAASLILIGILMVFILRGQGDQRPAIDDKRQKAKNNGNK